MTLSALEPVKEKILTPAVEVASGKATVEQVHQKYGGMLLLCPHCLQEWSNRAASLDYVDMMLGEKHLYSSEEWLQGLKAGLDRTGLVEKLQQGVGAFPELLWVRFRRGTLKQDKTPLRWMHWVHTRPREDTVTQPPCHDPGCIHHSVAVGSIELYLQDEYGSHSNIQVVREKELIITPGEPPLKRRPDLVVVNGDRVERVLEIQRTVLSYNNFVERTRHLQSRCSNVEWYFFRGTYNKMGEQRRWLTEVGLTYYVLFWDGYRLVVERGTPPVIREQKIAGNASQSSCRYREPNEFPDLRKPQVIESFMPLTVVGKADFRARQITKPAPVVKTVSEPAALPDLTTFKCRVNDAVEVYLSGQWRKGVVHSICETGQPSVRLNRVVGKYTRYWIVDKPEHLRMVQVTIMETKEVTVVAEQLTLFNE